MRKQTLWVALLADSVIWMVSPPLSAQVQGESYRLLEEIRKEGITESDIEAATPVMQELAAGNLSEEEAKSRLINVADGRLVKYLSNRFFRHFFRKGDATDIVRFLKDRGFDTQKLEELLSRINLYFRPQTGVQSARWAYAGNTLFVPPEFGEEGTNKIRTNLEPHQVNTLIHELDHAEKDFYDDLLRFRGKSLGGKIHTGFTWGGMLAVLALAGTTLLGNAHKLKFAVPSLDRLTKLAYLAGPHTSLLILAGGMALGVGAGLLYHTFSSHVYSDKSTLEEENFQQIEKISAIIRADPSQKRDPASLKNAGEGQRAGPIVHIARFGLTGGLVGGAMGLFLGILGLGPRLLGKLKWLRKYPWAMAWTCAAIGMIAGGVFGGWQDNTFARPKAWEISGYFSGTSVQEVLGGMNEIEWYNTKMVGRLSVQDLEQLQEMDQADQFKLLLPDRFVNLPGNQSESSLAQLTLDDPDAFTQFGSPRPEFQAYYGGAVIKFPFEAHPEIFDSLFTTSLGLNLGQLTYDKDRSQYNYRGIANFIERSKLPYFQRLRHEVRKVRAEKIQELRESG